ncbi:PilW family protein [Neobacillus terrae]|uniref:PilW family protein n=1 Tax=Neobacillus terrae TaxID=3034837 RepID=UPI0014095015|nr:prepilin-type N-terminal cleavage/methylation domain-containing protein [Neobacillus terrae]NHM30487.1 hypothetical protein [Neobacillus terrae]
MRDEKGITLIELLAALSLMMVVSLLIYGVFFDTNKNYSRFSEKTSLQQEANLMIMTIKSYQQKEDSYLLSYDSSKDKAFIGKSEAKLPLHRNDITVTSFKAGNNYFECNDTNILDIGNFTVIPPSQKQLFICIKLKNKQGQTYQINTSVKRY